MIKAIINFFARLFGKNPKPDITIYEVPSATVQNELTALNISLLYIPMDLEYFYTTEWGWKQAVEWVRKVYKFPKWTAEKTDCDDFAFLMKGLLATEFGLNASAFIIGSSPAGGHAFNKVRVAGEPFPSAAWKDLEPQTGGWPDNYVSTNALL